MRLIGLVPGIGDAITTLMSLYIVHEAHQLGAPTHLIARMLANVALDGVVGAVPLVGDAFDVLWRSNRRNMALLQDYLRSQGEYASHTSLSCTCRNPWSSRSPTVSASRRPRTGSKPGSAMRARISAICLRSRRKPGAATA